MFRCSPFQKEVVMAKYERILLKVSGEALADACGKGIDVESCKRVAEQIKSVVDLGVQVGVVVGGGNFWRGRSGNMDRVTADKIGMLATVMNALALCDALNNCGVKSKVFSAVTVDKVASYNVDEARCLLQNGGVAVFGGGTGSPFFTTDTAVVLRACEMNAQAVFLAKAVDAIYDSDPKLNPNAKRFDEISFDEVIAQNLKAMDLTATAMCREYGVSAVCFGKDEPNGLLRILQGEKLGTVIK